MRKNTSDHALTTARLLTLIAACVFEQGFGQVVNSDTSDPRTIAYNSFVQQPSNQPQARNSTTLDRIVQLYSQALKGNFFSGKDAQYQFKASFFALGNLLSDTTWAIDTIYLRNKNECFRNLEVTVGLNMEQGGGINTLSPALKWAFMNHRERSHENFFVDLLPKLSTVTDKYLAPAVNWAQGRPDRLILIGDLNRCSGLLNFSSLNKAFDDHLDKVALQAEIDSILTKYQELADDVDRRALWTVTVGGDLPKGKGDSLAISTEYYHGWFKGVDLVVRGSISFIDTSSNGTSSLKRQKWQVSAGSDFIILKNKDKSLIDLAVAAEYGQIIKGLEANETKNDFDIALTLSPLLSQNFSLPITVKYDPKIGNFLGFLELQWCFKTSG